MNKSVTVTLFLDKRSKSLEKGIGMIKVNVYHNYKNKLFTTGSKAPEKEWKTLQRSIDENGLSGKVKNEYVISMYQELYENQNSDLNRAKKIVEQLGDDFSFEAFRYYFENKNVSIGKENKQSTDCIIQLLRKKAETLKGNEQFSHAQSHELAAKSLLKFIDSLTQSKKIEFNLSDTSTNILPFKSLSKDFLNNYEKFMLKQGNVSHHKPKEAKPASETTISIYLRCVKALYNESIEEGIISRDYYPFSKRKYVIPSAVNKKKALQKSDIDKIINYVPVGGEFEERSWRLWIFSYLSNGMNVSDICRLMWSSINLKDKKIEYVRTKTLHSTKEQRKKITTMIFPQIEETINLYGTKDKSGYIFPFISILDSEERKKEKIHQLIKITNKHMRRIATKLEIEGDVNTYSARHSFATTLLRNNTSVALISQLLGHKKIQTTENYLGKFDDGQIEEQLLKLL